MRSKWKLRLRLILVGNAERERELDVVRDIFLLVLAIPLENAEVLSLQNLFLKLVRMWLDHGLRRHSGQN